MAFKCLNTQNSCGSKLIWFEILLVSGLLEVRQSESELLYLRSPLTHNHSSK